MQLKFIFKPSLWCKACSKLEFCEYSCKINCNKSINLCLITWKFKLNLNLADRKSEKKKTFNCFWKKTTKKIKTNNSLSLYSSAIHIREFTQRRKCLLCTFELSKLLKFKEWLRLILSWNYHWLPVLMSLDGVKMFWQTAQLKLVCYSQIFCINSLLFI